MEPKKIDKNGNAMILKRRLESFFKSDIDINKIQNIKKAYDYGYTKTNIANFLNISNTIVSKYLKK